MELESRKLWFEVVPILALVLLLEQANSLFGGVAPRMFGWDLNQYESLRIMSRLLWFACFTLAALYLRYMRFSRFSAFVLAALASLAIFQFESPFSRVIECLVTSEPEPDMRSGALLLLLMLSAPLALLVSRVFAHTRLIEYSPKRRSHFYEDGRIMLGAFVILTIGTIATQYWSDNSPFINTGKATFYFGIAWIVWFSCFFIACMVIRRRVYRRPVQERHRALPAFIIAYMFSCLASPLAPLASFGLNQATRHFALAIPAVLFMYPLYQYCLTILKKR